MFKICHQKHLCGTNIYVFLITVYICSTLLLNTMLFCCVDICFITVQLLIGLQYVMFLPSIATFTPLFSNIVVEVKAS